MKGVIQCVFKEVLVSTHLTIFCYIIRTFQEQEGLEGCSVSLTLPSVQTWSTWPWWPAPCAGPGPTSSHSCGQRVWALRYHKTMPLAAGSRALSSVKQTQALGTAPGGNWRHIIYLQCFLMEHCALIMEMRIYSARLVPTLKFNRMYKFWLQMDPKELRCISVYLSFRLWLYAFNGIKGSLRWFLRVLNVPINFVRELERAQVKELKQYFGIRGAMLSGGLLFRIHCACQLQKMDLKNPC